MARRKGLGPPATSDGMSLVPERLRPYLAGVLGVVATGLGHLYLRRWLRGVGWLVLAFGITMAFVPQETLQAMSAGEAMSARADFYPTMAVQLAAAFDAFLLAYRENLGSVGVTADVDVPVVGDEDVSGDTVTCPNCGKDVDDDLGFCHWCTTEFASTGGESD